MNHRKVEKVRLMDLSGKTILTVTTLIAVYITLQLIADVTVFKMVTLFGISLPAGSLLYAVTFTWRDLIHKRLGRNWSRAAIFLAAFCNIGMAAWFILSIDLPSASFFAHQDAYAQVLGIVPRVVIASIIAEIVSELTDTEVYHRVEHKFTGRWQFMRVLVSNAVSAPLDAFAFGILAFAGTMPAAALFSILWGGTVFKWVVGYVVLPLVYISKDERMTLDVTAAPVLGRCCGG